MAPRAVEALSKISRRFAIIFVPETLGVRLQNIMNDRTDKEAGKAGQSHETRDPAGVGPAGAGAAGHDRTGGDPEAAPKALNNSEAGNDRDADGNRGTGPAEDHPDTEDVPDPASDVEAAGSLMRQPWSRRAVSGGLVLAVGGALFGLSRTAPRPVRSDGGMVPLRQPVASAPLPPEGIQPEAGEGAETPLEDTAAVAEPAKVPASVQRPAGPAQIAIVLDDLGLKQDETRWATNLPGPLTLAFLPYGQSLASHANRAKANGHEVILHLPMDPGGRADPGPQALRVGQDSAELERRLGWNLAQVPGIAGVNNHMGSALTENVAAMEAVLTRLKADGRYFLDSRTTARSAARAISDRLGVPYAERDVFLDNDTSPQAIVRQLAETEDLARRYGTAIAIGHPHRQTLKALETWVGEARERGFDIVPVSTVIATRGSALWRLARDRAGS